MNPERPQCRSKGLGSGFHLQIVKLVEKLRIIDSGHDEWLFFWNQQRKYFFQFLTLGYLYKYLLIPADEGVEINGMAVGIAAADRRA